MHISKSDVKILTYREIIPIFTIVMQPSNNMACCIILFDMDFFQFVDSSAASSSTSASACEPGHTSEDHDWTVSGHRRGGGRGRGGRGRGGGGRGGPGRGGRGRGGPGRGGRGRGGANLEASQTSKSDLPGVRRSGRMRR